MLRINLLPSYVKQRRLTARLIPAFALLLALCIAGPLAYYALKVQPDLNKLTTAADAAVAGKAVTDGLKAQAGTTLAQVAPIKAKLDFVQAVADYSRREVEVWNTLAYTTPKSSLIYTGASISGTTMSIKAYSPSVEEVGRYLQTMYHEPDFQSVVVDHVPAYPDNIRHFYYLDGVMVFADGAAAGAAGAGPGSGYPGGPPGGFAGGGFPGGPGGFPGAPGGQAAAGAPPNYTPDALGPNGPTNIPPGVGPPPAALTGGLTQTPAGQPGQIGQPAGAAGGYSPKFLEVAGRKISPFASPAVRAQILAQALRRVVVKTVSKGFDINVTAMLKQPLSLPTLPGSAPAATPGGPPGGFPGGPPGGPGGPPGGYPGAPPGPPAGAGRAA